MPKIEDPRDVVSDVHRVLVALARLSNCSQSDTLDGTDLAALFWLLSDRMGPAVERLEHFKPPAMADA